MDALIPTLDADPGALDDEADDLDDRGNPGRAAVLRAAADARRAVCQAMHISA